MADMDKNQVKMRPDSMGDVLVTIEFSILIADTVFCFLFFFGIFANNHKKT